jgi:cobalt-zinc-cadmium efflux system outer membrane protein
MKMLSTILMLLLPLLLGAQAQQPVTKMREASGTQEQRSKEMLQIAVTDPMLPAIKQPQTGPAYGLADLEKKALQQNPTIAESQANVRISQAHKMQAGLWPNPTVGYLGDEIAGGIGVNGGRQGGFVEQTIFLGRKLYLAQQVAASDVRIGELEQEEQHYRVQNSVRAAYYRTLAAQELAALADRYVKLAEKTLETVRQLRNTGARDESEVAMAEIELERAKLGADAQHAHLHEEWEILRAVVGDPAMPIGSLAGTLEAELPQVDSDRLVNALITASPVARIAQENAVRAESSILEARRQAVPDLRIKAGVEQNFEQNELTGKPYGLEGFAEVRIDLPIFNRNQGNVASAQAELERSHAEILRIELQLRQQAALVVEQYEEARDAVDRYQKEVLPRSHRLYDMQLRAWGRMALSYPQVLLAEQSLFTAQAEYVHALERLRTNAVALSGFLQTDGLAAPDARN